MFCQATGQGKGAEVDFLCVSWIAQVGALPASVDGQLAALINSPPALSQLYSWDSKG